MMVKSFGNPGSQLQKNILNTGGGVEYFPEKTNVQSNLGAFCRKLSKLGNHDGSNKTCFKKR